MVNSLEALVLYTVPFKVVFDLLKAVWPLPLRKACVSALFHRSNTDELRIWAGSCRGTTRLPGHSTTKSTAVEWLVSPIALFFHRQVWGPFLHSPFFQFVDVFPDLDFRRQVLWPTHLCPGPRRCPLNWAARFWIPRCW